MAQPIERLRQASLPEEVIAFQRKFIKEIPIGTVVWKDAERRHYGTTHGGIFDNRSVGIYADPSAPTVQVALIDGKPDTWDAWIARDVVKRT